MGVLVWWVLPMVTTALAVSWATWVRRAPRRAGDDETVEAYARFRAALARSSAATPSGAHTGATTGHAVGNARGNARRNIAPPSDV